MSCDICKNCGSVVSPEGLCLNECYTFLSTPVDNTCVLCGNYPSTRQSEDGVDLCDHCGYIDKHQLVWAHEDLMHKYS